MRGILELHLLKLQEKSALEELKASWWKAPGQPCEKPKADSAEMSMESLGGVFLTLVIGVLVGVLIGLFEFWWDKSQAPYGERVRSKTSSSLLFCSRTTAYQSIQDVPTLPKMIMLTANAQGLMHELWELTIESDN